MQSLGDFKNLPPAIKELAKTIIAFESGRKGNSEGSNIKVGKARIKIACWVCDKEGIEPTLENLAVVLGPHFKEVLQYIPDVKKEMGYR